MVNVTSVKYTGVAIGSFQRIVFQLSFTFLLIACEPTADRESKNVTVDANIARPEIGLEKGEMFSTAAMPAYNSDHSAIYLYIDENISSHLENMQRWIRQRSVSAQNDGIIEMAEILRDDLEIIGFHEAEIVPTDGHPGVWGYYDAESDVTLMVYMMYDVQPANPDDWDSHPFDAKLVDHKLGKVLMGRGATNQKGPERAFLNALEAIVSVDGTLPVNVIIMAEGEEEIGSPNYSYLIEMYEDRLKSATGVLLPYNSQSADGSVSMFLGFKGKLYFELEARGGIHGGPSIAEIHGSYQAIVDSPAWRLIGALSSLVSKDGNTILVPEYYDDIRPPDYEESKMLRSLIAEGDLAERRVSLGVDRWVDDMSDDEALIDLLYLPTLNIDGLWSGYTGEGAKTILPHVATAKLDSRLPPNIDPDKALAKIRNHLDANGFSDVEMRSMGAYPASQSSVDTPIVQVAISVASKYVDRVVMSPRLAASAAFTVFTERLNIPMVAFGLGWGEGLHAPNEMMLIEPNDGTAVADLGEIEKAYVDFLYALAGN